VFAFIFASLFVLLVFLHFDTVLLLELLQPQRVGHQRLVSGLFLLLDSEQGIFAYFGGGISYTVCKLRCNEVLV